MSIAPDPDQHYGPPPAPDHKKSAVAVGVSVLAGIGLVMSMQSTSLMNGTGSIWLGVALVAVALAASFFLGAATWAKVVVSILLALALFSALYMEDQMNDKRQEIQHSFDQLRGNQWAR